MDVNKDIIGRGWSFPPTFILDGMTGDVLMSEGKKDIDNSLHVLLNTAFGERIMLPEYGCDLRKFLFDPVNASLEAYIKKIVQEAILYFEPRIRPDEVTINVDHAHGLMEIGVVYVIKTTNSRGNFVFPFFLKG